jgi:AAA+ ATPase superfamily predicted ATPase
LGHFSNSLLDGCHNFEFDKVLTGDKTTNSKFYSKAIRPYTKHLIKGRNSTIIIFGPSHSGKSFVMNGGQNSNDPSVVLSAAEDLFEYIDLSNETDDPLIFKVSSYMIYLEKIVDMLSPRKTGVKLDHFLSASREEVISKITNLKERIVPKLSDFKNIITEINRNKKLHTALLKSETMLDRKCHLIISLKLDRKFDNKFMKFAQMNFAEL